MTFDGVVLIKAWDETTSKAFKERTRVVQVEKQSESHALRKLKWIQAEKWKSRLKASIMYEGFSPLFFFSLVSKERAKL